MIDSWVWDWVWAGPCYRDCTRATNYVTGNCYQDILASFFYSGRKRSWSLVGHTLTPAAVLVSGTIGSPRTQCSSHRCLQRDPAQNLPEKPQQPQRAVWLDETIHITFTGLKWRFMWRLSWFSWKTTSVISCFRFLKCAQQKHWNIIHIEMKQIWAQVRNDWDIKDLTGDFRDEGQKMCMCVFGDISR